MAWFLYQARQTILGTPPKRDQPKRGAGVGEGGGEREEEEWEAGDKEGEEIVVGGVGGGVGWEE